jgi:acetyltransferase
VTRKHALYTLFNPGSIAVIGASRDAKSIRGRFVDFLARGGYEGKIFPVNPSYPEIAGRECFPSVAAVRAASQETIDLALIAIPADAVLPELERCAAAGVRNVLVVSSGFAEEGGERSRLQARISAVARASGMRIVGPNSEGFLNAVGRVSASFSPTVEYAWKSGDGGKPVRKRVAVVAQSGGMGFGVMHRGLAAGLAFSNVISTGNEADVSLADCLDYMVADPHTDAIVLFLESVRDAVTFEAACARALAVDKPIVAIKVGRSEAGQRAAASHTASIAGWSAAYDAVFAKFAVVACADTGEAMAALGVLTTCPPLKGNRAAVLTGSGGAGALVSDALERNGFVLPVLSSGVQQAIRAFVPSYATAQNPVDVTAGTAHLKAVVRAADVLLAADEIDLLVTIHSFTSESAVSFDPQELARGVPASGKALTTFCYTEPSRFGRSKMAEAGIFVHSDAQLMGAALAKALVRSRRLARRTDARSENALSPSSATAVAALEHARAKSAGGALCEYQVKALLRECGIAASSEALCKSADEAVSAAEKLGFPVALKIQSPAILHKTEIGGVKLGIATPAETRAAYAALMDSAARAASHANVHGVLVQKMAPRGHEVIVGAIDDATFGPVMMVGLGGIAVELYKDVAYWPAPLSPEEAEALVRSLKSSALFDGFRGSKPIDVGPLAELISRVSHVVAAAARSSTPIGELELNPVIVHADGSGLTIADALLRWSSPRAS